MRTSAPDVLARSERWAAVRGQVEKTLARLARGFDPDEPRDESGKWTDGGGGDGGAGAGTGAPADKPAETEKPAASAADKPEAGGKKKAELADFAKDDVLVDERTRTDPERQKKFLDKWNEHIAEAPAEFKKEFLGGLKGTMGVRYVDSEDTISIQGQLQDAYGRKIGDYTRDIDLADNKAHSSYFKIDSDKQGSAIGKRMLAANVATYQKMGLDSVEVHANINIGGYAWAKYGYVPTDSSWGGLASEIEHKIDRMSSGGGGGGASSWEELSDHDQQRIENAFRNSTRDEFIESEISNWRDGGEPLEQAKVKLADDYKEGIATDFAEAAIAGYRKAREDAGKSAIPFSDADLIDAMEVDYSSRYQDGRGSIDVTFDDEKLNRPEGYDPNQPTLPGIEPLATHERLTEEMRDGLTSAYEKAFDREAESKASDAEPPDFSDSVAEYQSDYWEGLGEREKFRWAERNEPDLVEGGGDTSGTGEISEEDADRLRALTSSDDPKALWTIADSKYGKDLLLGTDWFGTLDLDDKETMDRFNAYVGKASKAA